MGGRQLGQSRQLRKPEAGRSAQGAKKRGRPWPPSPNSRRPSQAVRNCFGLLSAVARLIGVPVPLAVGAEVLVGDDGNPVGLALRAALGLQSAPLRDLDRVATGAIVAGVAQIVTVASHISG